MSDPRTVQAGARAIVRQRFGGRIAALLNEGVLADDEVLDILSQVVPGGRFTLWDERRLAEVVAEMRQEMDVPVPTVEHRGPGRPGWTRSTYLAHWQAAVEGLPEPHTYPRVAERFKMLDGAVGPTPAALGKLDREYRRSE